MDYTQLGYKVGSKGYSLTYKGFNIGGAGTRPTDKPMHWRHARANIKDYREICEREIQNIKAGVGDQRFLLAITEIDTAKSV